MAAKNDEKMSVFEQIREGLNESLAHVRGQLDLRTTTLPKPAPVLSKSRVAAIRKKAGMSQALFAGYLNVPKSTLQSWEQGARQPKASEARLLQIFDADPGQVGRIIQASGHSTTPARGRRTIRLTGGKMRSNAARPARSRARVSASR